MVKIVTVVMAFFSATIACAQLDNVWLSEEIKLGKDMDKNKRLMEALQRFLHGTDKGVQNTEWVYEKEKIETLLLLEEMKNISWDKEQKVPNVYKPQVTNVVPLENSDYLVQIAYLGVQGNTPILQAIFELIAHERNGMFRFSSPLLRNTRDWKTKKTGNTTFYYKSAINPKTTEAYNTLVTTYDAKLKRTKQSNSIYCSGNLQELLRLIGVLYSREYNGRTSGYTSLALGNRVISVLGNNPNFNAFDPHDLWHDRLGLVVSRSKVNKPVDEGCAYYYGGSWGLTWKEIFQAFREQIVSQRPDWRAIKEKRMNFTTKGYNNAADYIVNALLIKKIEKEQGFAGVWKLLNCGPYEKGNERYYQTLEVLTGITKETYNSEVWELINQEK